GAAIFHGPRPEGPRILRMIDVSVADERGCHDDAAEGRTCRNPVSPGAGSRPAQDRVSTRPCPGLAPGPRRLENGQALTLRSHFLHKNGVSKEVPARTGTMFRDGASRLLNMRAEKGN